MLETVLFRNLGLALKILREQKGLNLTNVAKTAGMGKGQLSQYERGKKLPQLDSLERTLDVLGSSPLALFYVVHLLDQVETGAPLSPLILESKFAPVITEAEQEAFTRLIKDLFQVFFEQIKARTLLGLQLGESAPEDPDEESTEDLN